jgi:molybdopterin converting factor small subunit
MIPGALREFSGGHGQVEITVKPANVDQALLALWTMCPGMRDRVVTEQGQVRPHINVFVGDENIRYSGGLATPISAESVISIVPAVSGGANQILNAAGSTSEPLVRTVRSAGYGLRA